MSTDEALKALTADWPLWEVWLVHRHIGGTLFCARRWDSSGHTLNADSAEELAALIEAEVSK
jgi:hypothetical protein